ncbi:MAG TPA: hypothetical protein VK896_03510 [Gaiellaceae bacterium]|nr:hypothetical protein [Gaiellaceae bacterium]
MEPFPDSARGTGSDGLADRVEGLVGWIHELDSRVRATELASGDEKTAKELRKAVEALAKHDPKLEERLTNRVDVLADRVATLAGTVATTTSALGGKDGELAALRRELALATGAVAELQTEARRTSPQAELDDLRRAIDRLAAERSAKGESKKLADLEKKIAFLAERVDTVSTTVSTAAAGIAGAEGEVAGLRRRFDEEGDRIAATVAELRASFDPARLERLRATVDALSSHASTLEQETRRDVVALGVDLETVMHRLTALDASVASALEVVSGTGPALAALGARVQVDEERSVALERALATVHDRAESLGRQVEELAMDDATGVELAALGRRIEDGEARSASFEHSLSDLRGRLTEAVARAEALAADEATGVELAALGRRIEDGEARSASFEHALFDLRARFGDSAARVEDLAATLRAGEEEAGRDLTGLATRFEAGCAQVDALVHDLRESLERRPEPSPADSGLTERVDLLAAEMDSAVVGVARTSEQEAARLRALLDLLTARVATAESELGTLAPATEAVTRVQELSRRVDALETSANALPPVAGEGRLRVELRALELRLEHAEAAAREGRGSVLTQMERLAAEIEARLQRLEVADPAAGYAETTTDGRVIPIRSSEA